MVQVSVLYLVDCPNWQEAGRRVRHALDQAGHAHAAHELRTPLTTMRTTETGGHVVIATDSATDAHLRVTNTGQRIEPDDVDRLFEPFVRGSVNHPRTDHGVGLGLSIVRAVVDAHDGQLTAGPQTQDQRGQCGTPPSPTPGTAGQPRWAAPSTGSR